MGNGRVWAVIALAALVTCGVVVARICSGSAGELGPVAVPASDAPRPTSSMPTAISTGPAGAFPDLAGLTDVSQKHAVPRPYPLTTFTSPSGLQCAMWSSRGDTAASCFGPIPRLDPPSNQAYAGDYGAHFAQDASPDADKLGGKPLAAGEKIVLGAGGTLMGGDQITCGVQGEQVACELIRGFAHNGGGPTAQRHGFVLGPQSSWTF